MAGNFFCGWVCLFGFIQDLSGKIGSFFIKKKFKTPPAVQKYLQFSRYILLPIMLLGLLPLGMRSYISFMRFLGGGRLQILALVIMVSFMIIGLVFDRPFCNYFCTEGIKYGAAGFFRRFGIKRSESRCIGCKKCDRACPMNIQISQTSQIRNMQCINFFRCTDTCPVSGALTFGKMENAFLKKEKDTQLNLSDDR